MSATTVSVTTTASLPSTSKALVSAKGKTLGTRYLFGATSAKELKEMIRKADPKLSSRKVADKVNEALCNEAAHRRVVLGGAIAALGDAGYVADSLDLKAKSGVLRFVRPEDPEAKKVEKAAAAAVSSTVAMLKSAAESLGLTPEQMKAMFGDMAAAAPAAA